MKNKKAQQDLFSFKKGSNINISKHERQKFENDLTQERGCRTLVERGTRHGDTSATPPRLRCGLWGHLPPVGDTERMCGVMG